MGQKKKKQEMKKNKQNKKKVVIVFALFGIIFLLILVNVIEAETIFYQTSNNLGNGSVQSSLETIYLSSNSEPSFWGSLLGVNSTEELNFVPFGKDYEVPLKYSTSISIWNKQFPDRIVDNCSLNLYTGKSTNYFGILSKNLVFSQVFTNISDANDQYFFSMYDYDYFMANMTCNFENADYDSLDIPATMSIYTPTWECKACQMSQWSTQISNTQKSTKFQSYNNHLENYITKLSMILYEIALDLFWLFLFAMLFFIIGSIFWIGYYLFFWINNIGR